MRATLIRWWRRIHPISPLAATRQHHKAMSALEKATHR